MAIYEGLEIPPVVMDLDDLKDLRKFVRDKSGLETWTRSKDDFFEDFDELARRSSYDLEEIQIFTKTSVENDPQFIRVMLTRGGPSVVEAGESFNERNVVEHIANRAKRRVDPKPHVWAVFAVTVATFFGLGIWHAIATKIEPRLWPVLVLSGFAFVAVAIIVAAKALWFWDPKRLGVKVIPISRKVIRERDYVKRLTWYSAAVGFAFGIAATLLTQLIT